VILAKDGSGLIIVVIKIVKESESGSILNMLTDLDAQCEERGIQNKVQQRLDAQDTFCVSHLQH
jgi:hypothetical protein